MDQFWLTDEQFARIAPHLPADTRGKERVDDRRVISGIVHVLKSGGRWTDAPREVYGLKKTLYNRFVRWAAKGVWVALFETLAQAGGPPSQVLIDSTAVKAHRCAAGGKGGEQTQAIGRSRGGRTTKISTLPNGSSARCCSISPSSPLTGSARMAPARTRQTSLTAGRQACCPAYRSTTSPSTCSRASRTTTSG